MRLGELQALKKENIHLDKNYMVGGIKTEAGIDREIVIAGKIKPIVEHFYHGNKAYLLETGEKIFYEKYYEALARAGARRLTPHCCRHTSATTLANAGVHPSIIMAILGHEKYDTTLQYTHISLESARQSEMAVASDRNRICGRRDPCTVLQI